MNVSNTDVSIGLRLELLWALNSMYYTNGSKATNFLHLDSRAMNVSPSQETQTRDQINIFRFYCLRAPLPLR